MSQHKVSYNGLVPPSETSVAVAVKGAIGDRVGGRASRRAVRWAVENLLPRVDRFILVHVIPVVTAIPSPTGEKIPINELEEGVVEMYMKDMRREFEQVFLPFKYLCKNHKVETLLLDHDEPAKALLRYTSASKVSSLVMGSFASNVITRKLKGPGVPTTVLKYSPPTCEVFVVCKNRIVTKSVDHLLSSETMSNPRMSTQDSSYLNSFKSPSSTLYEGDRISGVSQCNLLVGESRNQAPFALEARAEVLCDIKPYESNLCATPILSMVGKPSGISSPFSAPMMSPSRGASVLEKRNHHTFNENTGSPAIKQLKPKNLTKTKPSDGKDEMERLKLRLQYTAGLYKEARAELFQTQNKVQLLSSECNEESEKVNDALEREETLRKAAAEGRAKHFHAMKEVEEAKALLAKEFCERHLAELNALQKSLEKKKIIDRLYFGDKRYRKYSSKEIEVATNSFAESNVIGEGGFGKVYKCSLDHIPVAVKVIRPDGLERKEEFLKEVEVLSQLRHPHVVLLLGACPESGCLVYEYLENGNLEDYILHRPGKPPLPWFIRFRIIFEVACGLAFLHNSKPEPTVHRDLKPGNILLDRNYVSKIGDVGLAKMVSNVAPDNITAYANSFLAGTLHYMDPEYQKTGTLRPKSDIYAFGIIILQLLTGRHPNGLILRVEDALKKGTFVNILDKSITDWPAAEAKEVAEIALKCTQLRCRDRPDLDKEVLPILKTFIDVANAKTKVEKNNLDAPGHYICPILEEIMENPHVAADGFTYEHKAILTWLEKYDVSPITKQKLQHFTLVPNHTLRSAIHEWRARLKTSKVAINKR